VEEDRSVSAARNSPGDVTYVSFTLNPHAPVLAEVRVLHPADEQRTVAYVEMRANLCRCWVSEPPSDSQFAYIANKDNQTEKTESCKDEGGG
jgi:hypothetical protein